jgi:hypothetical protein
MPYKRRSPQDIDTLKSLIKQYAEEEKPTTLRHIFYRMVAAGAIKKDENDYQNVVIRLASKMRLSHELPFHWIADNSRMHLQPTTYDSIEQSLMNAAHSYRKNLWNDQNVYCEIWIEKDAIAGIVSPITSEYDVPLYPCRGQASLSYLYSAAEAIEKIRKDTYIYLLTDYDKSGYSIDRNIRNRLVEFSGRVINFKRLAVTKEQIEEYSLPTRPPKERYGFSENVELDAMSSKVLRDLVKDAIEQHMPRSELEKLKRIEDAEKTNYLNFIKQFNAKT